MEAVNEIRVSWLRNGQEAIAYQAQVGDEQVAWDLFDRLSKLVQVAWELSQGIIRCRLEPEEGGR